MRRIEKLQGGPAAPAAVDPEETTAQEKVFQAQRGSQDVCEARTNPAHPGPSSPFSSMAAWHGLQSRLPAFVALLSPAAREAIAARALAIGYGVGLTLAMATMTAWAMP